MVHETEPYRLFPTSKKLDQKSPETLIWPFHGVLRLWTRIGGLLSCGLRAEVGYHRGAHQLKLGDLRSSLSLRVIKPC